VIMGLRPEHFEDARLVDEAVRSNGVTFTDHVDVLESMGSDKYAYFNLTGEQAASAELQELAADAGADDVPGDGISLVTRLSSASGAVEGASADIWFDADKIQLFDPSSGRNLTYTER
jgi:multiple sugar transport system ATP-binding protein